MVVLVPQETFHFCYMLQREVVLNLPPRPLLISVMVLTPPTTLGLFLSQHNLKFYFQVKIKERLERSPFQYLKTSSGILIISHQLWMYCIYQKLLSTLLIFLLILSSKIFSYWYFCSHWKYQVMIYRIYFLLWNCKTLEAQTDGQALSDTLFIIY